MLEYLCLLQYWYWSSPGTSIYYSSTCTQTLRFNCVHSVNIPLIFRRILWDGSECGGGGWGLQSESPPPPLTVCHDWWLWATPKPPNPPDPHQSPWWLIYFKQKGVHKHVCVCWGHMHLKHWCILLLYRRDTLWCQKQRALSKVDRTFRTQYNEISLELSLLCCILKTKEKDLFVAFIRLQFLRYTIWMNKLFREYSDLL